MIAMLLAAQITAAALPQGLPLEAVPPPRDYIVPGRARDIIRTLPAAKACGAALGRLEVSMAAPIALYRKGDRPAKGLRNWVDYPQGQLCLVEAAR
jgi:hypothetical protein